MRSVINWNRLLEEERHLVGHINGQLAEKLFVDIVKTWQKRKHFLPGSFEKLTHGVEALYSFDEASGQGRRSNCCRLKPKTKSKQRKLKSVNEVCLSQEKIFSPVGQSSREVEPPSPGPGLSSLSRIIVFHLLALP